MKTDLDVIDSSMIQSFMDCPRSYFYRYVLGWTSVDPKQDLVFGSSWHLALEHLLQTGNSAASVSDAHALFLQEYRQSFPESSDEIYKSKNPNNALLALIEYSTKYADNNDNQVLYTEVAGKVPITSDQDIHFRIDAILRNKAGKIFVLEHKTGSVYSPMWETQWPLKVQIGTYTHVLHCLAKPEDIDGVVVNATFFGRTNSKIDFHRLPIKKTLADMQQWMYNTQFWLAWIRQELENLKQVKTTDVVMSAFPLNTESCSKYFGCPYHDLCTSWTNPLRQCEQYRPVQFKEEYWDPRDYEKKAKYIVTKDAVERTEHVNTATELS